MWRDASISLLSAVEFDYSTTPWVMADRLRSHGQIWLITAGAATMSVGMHQVSASPGTAIVVPPQVWHRGSADPQLPFRGFVLHHALSTLGVSVHEALQLLPVSLQPRVRAWHRMIDAAAEMRRESQARKPCFELLADAEMTRLVGLYWREAAHAASADGTSAQLSASAQPRLSRVMAHIARNVGRRITLDELAAAAHLSPAYLSTMFRRTTGLTLSRYINQYRVQRAKELLKYTNDPVADVGAAVGFADPYYFSRVFSRLEQHSPSQYRATQRTLEKP